MFATRICCSSIAIALVCRPLLTTNNLVQRIIIRCSCFEVGPQIREQYILSATISPRLGCMVVHFLVYSVVVCGGKASLLRQETCASPPLHLGVQCGSGWDAVGFFNLAKLHKQQARISTDLVELRVYGPSRFDRVLVVGKLLLGLGLGWSSASRSHMTCGWPWLQATSSSDS
jgi:hypothetical protein